MSLQDVPVKNEYRSLIDNVVQDFYLPLLKEATVYKRAVGFFSSSSLRRIYPMRILMQLKKDMQKEMQ